MNAYVFRGRWGWAWGLLDGRGASHIESTWREAFDAAFQAVHEARGYPMEQPC